MPKEAAPRKPKLPFASVRARYYAKDPEVGGHLVLQPRRHVERITQLSGKEWSDLSNLIYRYSKAVKKAPMKRNERADEVDCIYLRCFCNPKFNHLHFQLRPRPKRISKVRAEFLIYSDKLRSRDETCTKNIMEEIREFL